MIVSSTDPLDHSSQLLTLPYPQNYDPSSTTNSTTQNSDLSSPIHVLYNTSTPITCIKKSLDERFLAVGDESGCIILYEISTVDTTLSAAMSSKHLNLVPELVSVSTWTEEVLIPRQEWVR